jgi:hypothetical protein
MSVEKSFSIFHKLPKWGQAFKPAGAFQATRCELIGKVATPRRSAAAAQKG